MLNARLLSLLPLLMVVACAQTPARCVPGQSAACACPEGRTGAQICGPDGTFGACTCQGGDDRDQGGTRDLRGEERDLRGGTSDLREPDLASGPDCPASTSPCWASCSLTTSECAQRCGMGDGIDCWQRCEQRGLTTTDCSRICGTSAPCAGVLCWRMCESRGLTTTDCANLCKSSKSVCTLCRSMSSSYALCWDMCRRRGLTMSTCLMLCGP
jgi:hypothetical protein